MSKECKCEIISNEIISGGYYKIKFYAPEISMETKPGQFVHVQIANLQDRILRRPFSICNVNQTELTVIYKVVGEGTKVLATLPPKTKCNLLGPLGNPFTVTNNEQIPIIIAGGYGSAATYILAKSAKNKGSLLLGARSKNDLILTDEFKKLGFDVNIATNDGSSGHKGLVTDLIEPVIKKYKNKELCFYACGPYGMLMAVGRRLIKDNLNGELSLDHLMCCGVGACFACVIKVKANNKDGWRYARTCNEGPVFNAQVVYYE